MSSLALYIVSFLLDIPSVLLIYAVIMKTPEKMKFIRLFLLKMTICDTILTHSALWGYGVDIFQSYFPLPLLKVGSCYAYFKEIGGIMAIVTVLGSNGLSLIALLEATVMRFAITYNIELIFTFGTGIWFFLLQLFEIFVIAIIMTTAAWLIFDGKQGLLQFVVRHNASRLLENFDMDKDVFTFFAPDNPVFPYVVVPIVLCLFLFPIALCGLIYLTHRKIRIMAKSMSTDTYSLQKRITILLIIHTFLPVIMTDLPFAYFGISMITTFSSNDAYLPLYDHPNCGFTVMGAFIGVYPLLNTIAVIFIIKPYRRANFQLLLSIWNFFIRKKPPPIGASAMDPSKKPRLSLVDQARMDQHNH